MDSRPPSVQALFPLINRRFQSFAEAAETGLEVLARALPGTVALGRTDPDDGLCRVSDVRGDTTEAVEPRGLLPQVGSGAELDTEVLASRGIRSSVALPLELSDGTTVGIVCALSPEADAYRTEHLIVLGLVARTLSYEWERVHTRAELRQLRLRVRAGVLSDRDTGLPGRSAFTALLDREWRLAQRGTLGSGVLVCRVWAEAKDPDAGDAQARLAVKDAAEVLAAVARTTDHVGRVGESTLAVAMVGSEDPSGAEAFQRRFLDALRRISGSRPAELSVGFGFATLSDAPSAEQALMVAERAAERGEPIAATRQAELL